MNALPELSEDFETTVERQHHNRSAEVYVTAMLTRSYIGECREHDRPVRYDSADDLGDTAMVPCTGGDHQIRARRLLAVKSKIACDGACQAATRRLCSCGCGGINHGAAWMVLGTLQMGADPASLSPNAIISHRLVPADELAAWRERRRQAEAAKHVRSERRRETAERKARQAFDDWAAEHAPVIEALAPWAGSSKNRFLAELADQVTGRYGKPRALSEAQVDSVFRVIADHAERARRVAEREAARRPVPTGRQKISGRVVKVAYDSTDRPGSHRIGPEHKMTISCDGGYAVRVTVPRLVADWARANRREVLNRDWRDASEYEISERWTEALKGPARLPGRHDRALAQGRVARVRQPSLRCADHRARACA